PTALPASLARKSLSGCNWAPMPKVLARFWNWALRRSNSLQPLGTAKEYFRLSSLTGVKPLGMFTCGVGIGVAVAGSGVSPGFGVGVGGCVGVGDGVGVGGTVGVGGRNCCRKGNCDGSMGNPAQPAITNAKTSTVL